MLRCERATKCDKNMGRTPDIAGVGRASRRNCLAIFFAMTA
jgi:hypothetical protein